MSSGDIAQRRLFNQHIISGVFAKPEDELKWLVAMQAQDYSGAKWSLGLRVRGAVDDDIEQAFNSGLILRTHLLRPTWHFVAPEDIRWLLALTAPRVHAANAYMYRQLELDQAVFRRSNTALSNALTGGKHLTRDELRLVLQQAGIATDDGMRMSYLMMHAELDGLICSGARRGKQFTYALLEDRVPSARTPARDEALAEFTRRYFTSRGPATAQDFAKWSGLRMTDARNGLASVEGLLQSVEHEGQTYWFADLPRVAKAKSPTGFLLSVYDEYISSYKDRSAIVNAMFAEKLIAQGNALTYVIVISGQIVGSWKRTFAKDVITIETNLFRPLTKPEQQALASAAQKYAEFFKAKIVFC